MNWLWPNIVLGASFFLAVTGIPLWLVLRHPDTGPLPAFEPGQVGPGRPVAATLIEPDRVGVARQYAGDQA